LHVFILQKKNFFGILLEGNKGTRAMMRVTITGKFTLGVVLKRYVLFTHIFLLYGYMQYIVNCAGIIYVGQQ
jgi:hypothetical protein